MIRGSSSWMSRRGVDPRFSSLNAEAPPVDKEQQPELRPRGHRSVEERGSVEDLTEVMRELISAIYELRDSLSLDRWNRTYGKSDSRPVTPLGQRDPDIGNASR